MTKEEKKDIFNKYIEMRGISMRKFSEEVGYNECVLSTFKNGSKEVPRWMIWGIQQSIKALKLQELIEK